MSDFHNYIASDLQLSLDRMTEDRDRWRKVSEQFAKAHACCMLCVEQAIYEYEKVSHGG